jgi:signal transduction histidine kinase
VIKGSSFYFRWFIIFLFVMVSIATLLISGTVIFMIRSSTVTKETARDVTHTAKELARRTEALLGSVEQVLLPLSEISLLMEPDRLSPIIGAVMNTQPLIRSLYFIDRNGKTFAVGRSDGKLARDKDYIGIDFSYSPLYLSLSETKAPVWSDKFISTLSGNTSVGVGLKIGDNAVIAELALESLLSVVETAGGKNVRVLVIDRRGELVVDTAGKSNSGILNVRDKPYISTALKNEKLPNTIELDGTHYHPAYTQSGKLGWFFFACMPAGLDNPNIRNIIADMLLLSISFLIVAFLLTPAWSFYLSGQVAALREQADNIAEGKEYSARKEGFIKEFNDLSGYLQLMAERIREREYALRALNEELEKRVADRTHELEKSNLELRESLEKNSRIQGLLVRTEKLAALGRMVAGVAHEMNTPIGNAIMSVSRIREDKKILDNELKEGLRRSSLEQFLESSEMGLDIAERNLTRAAELVSSFKHVASDQTSSVRRKFELTEMLQDLFLTLHPMLKRSPHQLVMDIESGIQMESYPGALGQIITNLITNALTHAWDEGEKGVITVRARKIKVAAIEKDDVPSVRISVGDDGKGIPRSIRGKIFEPFFTTRMGRGGTGLGLNIAYNGARNVLGGILDFESEAGKGTVFYLDIPLTAPKIAHEDGI